MLPSIRILLRTASKYEKISCRQFSSGKEIDASQSLADDVLSKLHSSKYVSTYPDSPVPLDSPLYIERPPMDKLAYQEITQPGCVLRIRAPRYMGKSSLVLRLYASAQQQGYYTVTLDCDQIDSLYMSDLNQFLRCFCWRVANELGINPNLDANWDEEIGSKLSCSLYWQKYLLKQIKSPIVLVLEQVERLFEHPEIASVVSRGYILQEGAGLFFT